MYIENESNYSKAEIILSAIIYRYWGLIKQYYEQSPGVCEPEDVYGWLVDSIMYAIQHRRWEDKGSSIYQDKNGPDKVINRQMKCRRATYYQSINRFKRCGEFSLSSLDEWTENIGDDVPVAEHHYDEDIVDISDYIKKKFSSKEYESAYILDIIAFDQVFKVCDNTNKFNERMLVDELSNIDEDYLIRFAVRYDLPCEEENNCYDVLYTKKFINLSRNDWHNRIKKTFEELKHDRFIRQLRGA